MSNIAYWPPSFLSLPPCPETFVPLPHGHEITFNGCSRLSLCGKLKITTSIYYLWRTLFHIILHGTQKVLQWCHSLVIRHPNPHSQVFVTKALVSQVALPEGSGSFKEPSPSRSSKILRHKILLIFFPFVTMSSFIAIHFCHDVLPADYRSEAK